VEHLAGRVEGAEHSDSDLADLSDLDLADLSDLDLADLSDSDDSDLSDSDDSDLSDLGGQPESIPDRPETICPRGSVDDMLELIWAG